MALNSEHKHCVARHAVLVVHNVQLDMQDYWLIASQRRQSVSQLVYSDRKRRPFENAFSRVPSRMSKLPKHSK